MKVAKKLVDKISQTIPDTIYICEIIMYKFGKQINQENIFKCHIFACI